jgi:hypothetical protein
VINQCTYSIAVINQYGAQVVTKIDRRITDRHIFIAGGGIDPAASWRCQRGALPRTQAGGKTSGWVSGHAALGHARTAAPGGHTEKQAEQPTEKQAEQHAEKEAEQPHTD